MSETPAISSSLRRDLSLVLPASLLDAKPEDVRVDESAVARTADLLVSCAAPAIVGIASLSIEATRAAARLAEAARGRLLPWPLPADAGLPYASVTQTASLGDALACDLVVWVGGHGTENAVAELLASHQLKAAFVPATLDAVLALREAVAKNPATDPFGQHRRITVAISPVAQGDTRVIAQWHKLAASVQQHCRVSVVELPDLSRQFNARGAFEAVTWLTGVSPRRGGIDFSDGAPRQCPHLDTLLELGAIDLILDAAASPLPSAANPITTVRIGGLRDAGIVPSLTIPLRLLAPGRSCQVMRFDGQVLRMSDDPAKSPADPIAIFFESVAQRIRPR